MGYISPEELRNASVDAGTLEKFANGAVGEPNVNRAGKNVSNLATVADGVMRLGAATPYATLQELQADSSRPVGSWAAVLGDSNVANNGYYIKAAAGWEKSILQPASFVAATRNGYLVAGKLLSKVWDGAAGTWTISHSALRIFRGGARGLVNIPAASGVVVPQERAYVADVTGALSGATVTPYVTADNAYGSTYQNSEFVADEKLVLFLTTGGEAPYTNTGILNNGALITDDDLSASLNRELRAFPNAGRVWFGGTSSVSVGYDDGSRTLAWDGVIVGPMTAGGSRIQLAAQSVVIPSAAYQVVWIDLREVPLTAALTPPSAIKVGTYGTGASDFSGAPHQLPIFYRERAGVFGSVGGFFNIDSKPTPVGQVWFKTSASVSVDYDDSTRTLTWNGGLFCPMMIGGSTRVYIPATSITIPDATYQIVWIDLRRAPPRNADLPADAIKVGGYNGSTDNTFKGLPHQLPIFFRERAGVYGACSGFPYNAGGGLPGQASGLEFSKSANTATFHLNGTGSRKIELPLVRETVPFDGTSPNSQLDNWRLVEGWETSVDYVRGNQIINAGEWEMALRLSGSTDSVGGYHGDELLHDALFLIDGVPLAQTATATRRSVREVQVLQNSYVFDQNVQAIFDPGTGLPTNAIAKHSKRYTFTPEGIRISQRLEWLQARTLVSAWVTMFPILRNRDNTTGPLITDTALRSRLFETEDVSTWDAGMPLTYTPVSDGDSMSLWGATSGISGSVQFTKTPRLSNQKMYISTNTSAYNKVYFNLRGDSSAGDPEIVTTVGEAWEWEAFYQVNTAN